MPERRLTAEEEARRDQAIAWHIRLDAPDATEAEWLAFSAWLEADPANSIAFDGVEALDDELRSAEVTGEQAPVSLANARASQEMRPRRYALWFSGAGLLAASIAAFLFLRPSGAPVPTPTVYATQIGETKTITLADGTRVDLNTASTLSVGDSRRVTLVRGEALFRVTKDAAHPFTVMTGDRQIRVVGTVFDVLRVGGNVTVTVSEGRVAVARTGSAGGDRQLGRGDRLTCVEGSNVQTAERVDPAEAASWREGYLVYRDAPLSKVVADLNRYFVVEIVLDARVTGQRFTGVLRIDNQEAVLRRLTEFLPVVTFHRPDGKIGLRQASPTP